MLTYSSRVSVLGLRLSHVTCASSQPMHHPHFISSGMLCCPMFHQASQEPMRVLVRESAEEITPSTACILVSRVHMAGQVDQAAQVTASSCR